MLDELKWVEIDCQMSSKDWHFLCSGSWAEHFEWHPYLFHFCSLCPLWERVRLFISTFYILLLIRMFCVKITSNLYINAWGKIHTLYKIFILNAVKQTNTRHDVIRKTYLSFNLRWAIRYNLTEKRTQTISILLETRKILKFELER